MGSIAEIHQILQQGQIIIVGRHHRGAHYTQEQREANVLQMTFQGSEKGASEAET
jgi:hypothetical protein